jgi:hypothetical protein
MITRTKCDICDSHDIQPFFTLPNMPSRLGVKQKENENINFYDMIYASCESCLNVQLFSYPGLEEVYEIAHNNEIIGEKWTKHYQEFSSFILSNLKKDSEIFEIGDPTAKISSLIVEDERIKEWSIIEPNLNKIDLPKVKFINSFFDKNFISDKAYDCIVMSHVFEHLYDFSTLIPVFEKMLNENGKIIISVPNLKHLYDTNAMSPLGLHFEHTIYLDKNIIEFLLSKFNFELIDYNKYTDHSEFYCFCKSKNMKKLNLKINLNLKEKIQYIFKEKKDKIQKINAIVELGNYDAVFIYGAHIQTVMFDRLGLNSDLITGALDNDKSKHYKFLYGTNIKAFPPDILNQYQSPILICDMGAYTDEILKQMLESYPHTKII